MVERSAIRQGEKLVWQPSGALVDPLHITSPTTVRVRGPRGGEFNVNLENLVTPEGVKVEMINVE